MKLLSFPYAQTETLVNQKPMQGFKGWQVDATQKRLFIERNFAFKLRHGVYLMALVWSMIVIILLGIDWAEDFLTATEMSCLLLIWTGVCVLLISMVSLFSHWWFKRTATFEFDFQNEQLRIGNKCYPFKDVKSICLHTLLMVERFRSTYDFHNPVEGAEIGHQLRIKTYTGGLIQHITPFAFFTQQADAKWLAMALAQAMRVRYQFNHDPPKRLH